MNIIFYRLPAEDQEHIKSLLPDHKIFFAHDFTSLPEGITADEVEVISVFVDLEVTKENIDQFPKLKLIAARSTGYDYIDYTYAKERGIIVSTVPAYGSQTVAEFAFALMLTLSRRAYEAYDRLRLNGEQETDVHDFQGFNLSGKTLGIVGTGKIGKAAITIGQGFGMKVLAFDAFPNEDYAREHGFNYVPLDELLQQADIVSIHVPLLPSTHHLINAEKLALMKPTAFLINTARGEIVHTVELVKALKEKVIAGAGLDVLEGERELREELDLLSTDFHDINLFQEIVADHELINMPNVVVTPHIAFNTIEAEREIYRVTAENINSFAGGQALNVVQ